MDWKEIASKITSIAPALGGAIGGPVGALAGTAVSILAKALGLKEDAKPEEILKSISVDPEVQLKLLIAENEFKFKMKELELLTTKAYLADVQSARELGKAGVRDTNLYVLAWTIIGGFFALVGILTFVTVPQDSSGVIFMLFGALSAGFGAVIQYFFGSSAGSAQKSKALEEAILKGK